MKNTKVQELAKKIANANNIEMDKALEIAKKALNIKEETKAIEKEYYLFNDSETTYKGVKKWFAEKQFFGDKKTLGEISITFIKIVNVLKETEKAVQLEVETPYGISSQWYPKSVLLTK